MRIGASLFLIAIGAVLKWAVTEQVHGVNLSTVGIILMVVGAIGLVLSLVLATTRRRTDVIHESRAGFVDDRGTSRTTYVEPSNYDPRG
jgi:Domain of unknown function (DUF6458)